MSVKYSRRKDARAAGERFYFTGKPCPKGHLSARYSGSGQCLSCMEARYERRAEEVKAQKRDKYANDVEHREKILQYQKEYLSKNKDSLYSYRRDWGAKNRGKLNALSKKRKAAKKLRTPPWLTESDFLRIRCIYEVAAMRNRESDIEWHVDHIVPLQGSNVSGLHVPWNLQVIPAVENMKKNNRFHG